jgi:elongation of very long chain fatty acids protein 6
VPILRAMGQNDYVIPVACVVAYMLFCYFGQKIMENYKPFNLIGSLAAWNLFLSLFSTYGAIRTVPHLLHRISTLPFEQTVCEAPYVAYGNGACGLATQLFILSKIPELVDTVFIVLRKKPLIFLHWYHHVTVLLYCWNAYVTEASAGIYFVAMNYTVHAVMYFYYYLQAIRSVPKGFPTWIITLMQISQMIIGTFIVCASFYFHFYGGKQYAPGECNNSPSNLAAGGIIYASYLYLFVEFAVKRFIFGVSEAPRKKKTEKTN